MPVPLVRPYHITSPKGPGSGLPRSLLVQATYRAHVAPECLRQVGISQASRLVRGARVFYTHQRKSSYNLRHFQPAF